MTAVCLPLPLLLTFSMMHTPIPPAEEEPERIQLLMNQQGHINSERSLTQIKMDSVSPLSLTKQRQTQNVPAIIHWWHHLEPDCAVVSHSIQFPSLHPSDWVMCSSPRAKLNQIYLQIIIFFTLCLVIVSNFNILTHKQHVTCCICCASVSGLGLLFKSPKHLMLAEGAPSFSKVSQS